MTLLVITVVVALVFDFTNGFHDTANSVATSISTRALSPRLAVLIAAIANLAGAFATTAVAKTVGKGIIDSGLANEKTVLAAVLGAIVWNLLTWWLGLPSSSSHALIGGLVGAALVQSGSKGVEWHGIVHKVVIPAVWAPTLAFAGAFALLLAIYWVFQRLTPGVANRSFRLGQLVTGTWVGFAHGANDAQKTMGVIALALYAHGNLSHFYIPTWVKLAAGLAIAAGTYSGGWRIIRTLGPARLPDGSAGRIRRPGDGRRGPLRLDEVRLPALDHPCRLGRGHGLRSDEAALGRSLGRRRQHRDRVDPDDPGLGGGRGALLLPRAGDLLADAVRSRPREPGDLRPVRLGGRKRRGDRGPRRAALPRAPALDGLPGET